MLIRDTLQIPVTDRCEIVLALAFHFAPESVVPVAYRLANNSERLAIRAAEGLLNLPSAQASDIVLRTLSDAGLFGENTLRG